MTSQTPILCSIRIPLLLKWIPVYTNTIVTKANQLRICGLANASSWSLFFRIFCRWMCESSLSHENREGRHRMRWSFRVMRQCCSVSSYTVSHSPPSWRKQHLLPWSFSFSAFKFWAGFSSQIRQALDTDGSTVCW